MLPKDVNKSALDARPEDSSPESFFLSVFETFQEAERKSQFSCARYYDIGGYTIKLRFAGDALTPLLTWALEHLSCVEPKQEALTICVFDTVSTRTPMPPAPWSSQDYMARAEVRGFSNGRIHTAFDVGTGILNILDTDLNLGVFWIHDVGLLPHWESGAPLRVIIHWWMRLRGIQLLHASAVGTDKSGVLLAGKGGSGKSSSALACLNSELLYAADDYCLLAKEQVPFVHSLYNSGKVNAADIGKFLFLSGALSNADRLDREKALFFLNPRFKDKISRGFPVKAVLLPRLTGGLKTTLSAASTGEALRSLAPSTIFQLAGAGHSAFHMIAGEIRKLPCYYLNLGTDISEIPRVILGLLGER